MSDKIDPLTCLCEGNFECPTPDVCPEMFRRENDALRAENKELTAILNSHRRLYTDGRLPTWTCEATDEEIIEILLPDQEQKREISALRAENERLKAQHANDLHTIDVGSKANAALEIENERLNAEREEDVAIQGGYQMEQLVAENERLHEDIARYKAHMLRLAALETVVEENERLRAENERLKQGSDTMGPLEYIAFLRAENERLRAALELAHQHAYPKPGCAVCEVLGLNSGRADYGQAAPSAPSPAADS